MNYKKKKKIIIMIRLNYSLILLREQVVMQGKLKF